MARLRYVGKLLRELTLVAKKNKAYWIVPTVLLLILIGFLVFTGNAVAPFIYTIF